MKMFTIIEFLHILILVSKFNFLIIYHSIFLTYVNKLVLSTLYKCSNFQRFDLLKNFVMYLDNLELKSNILKNELLT